eukprot:scaffold2088_cov399-Prasinococcus_capsulatus_cf.AAC.36
MKRKTTGAGTPREAAAGANLGLPRTRTRSVVRVRLLYTTLAHTHIHVGYPPPAPLIAPRPVGPRPPAAPARGPTPTARARTEPGGWGGGLRRPGRWLRGTARERGAARWAHACVRVCACGSARARLPFFPRPLCAEGAPASRDEGGPRMRGGAAARRAGAQSPPPCAGESGAPCSREGGFRAHVRAGYKGQGHPPPCSQSQAQGACSSYLSVDRVLPSSEPCWRARRRAPASMEGLGGAGPQPRGAGPSRLLVGGRRPVLSGRPVLQRRRHGCRLPLSPSAACHRRASPLCKPGVVAVCSGAQNKDSWQASTAVARTADAPNQALPGQEHELVKLETNIDDMESELVTFASEQMLANGALDVWRTPIVMKKGRAAVMLSCICKAEKQEEIAELMLRETSSLGVRVFPFSRYVAPRVLVRTTYTLACQPWPCRCASLPFRLQECVDTKWGKVQVKVSGSNVRPEYEVSHITWQQWWRLHPWTVWGCDGVRLRQSSCFPGMCRNSETVQYSLQGGDARGPGQVLCRQVSGPGTSACAGARWRSAGRQVRDYVTAAILLECFLRRNAHLQGTTKGGHMFICGRKWGSSAESNHKHHRRIL